MRSILASLNVLGALLMLFAVLFALPMGAAVLWRESEALQAFGIGAAVSLAAGALLYFGTRIHRRYELKPRDGYLLAGAPRTAAAGIR